MDTKSLIVVSICTVMLFILGSFSTVVGYHSVRSLHMNDISSCTTLNSESDIVTEHSYRSAVLIEKETFLDSLNIGRRESNIQKRNDTDDLYKGEIFDFGTSSAYDYGVKAGNLLRQLYRNLACFCSLFEKHTIDANSLKNQISNLEETCPLFFEELKGLSESTNIDVEKLIIIFSMIHTLMDDRCTVTLATGKATKNNETFLTFSIDTSIDGVKDILLSYILHRIFCLKCWIAKVNTTSYKYAYWGIPILFEYPFINEEGLGLGSPGIVFTENTNRSIDEGSGIPTMILESMAMMTCKNVSEVATLYENSERALQIEYSWFNRYDGSSSSFCDKEGGIVIIEQTHNYFIAVFGNSTDVTGAPEGILWHTNHHLWLNPNLTGSVYPEEFPTSGFRAERAHELLERSYGDITLDACKKISRDHGGGYDPDKKDSGDICRHADSHSLKVTAFSWIIMPKNLTVYWTHTCPCRSVFWKYDFSTRFI